MITYQQDFLPLIEQKNPVMNTGTTELSVVSVRKDPSHRTEMSTQLLFGERFRIIDKINEWALIELFFDNSQGWVEITGIKELSEEQSSKINNKHPFILPVTTRAQKTGTANSFNITLMPGSEIYDPANNNKSFVFLGNEYKLDVPLNSGNGNGNIVKTAREYLNSPYLWGGKTPFGIDCAAFVQMVYKINNIQLPRDVDLQLKTGKSLNFIEEAQPGDLAFFDDENGNIKHVGILLENNRIIHATDCVRIDKLDHQGIFNAEQDQYTHKLRVIKRID